MENVETRQITTTQVSRQLGLLLAGLIPLLLLGVVLALFVVTGAGLVVKPMAPIEQLDIERIVLRPDEVVLSVRNTGAEPFTIAQILVDDADCQARVTPLETMPRFGSATISLNYPWVEGDPLSVKLITSNGLIFTREIEVAAPSPEPGWDTFVSFALVGIYVGIVPVGLGLLWFPFLRRMGRRGLNFVLALTVGLLVFLVVDTLLEALEVAEWVPGVFQGVPAVVLVTVLSFLGLVAVGQRRPGQSLSRLGLAYLIALGIGLHNLGEGLAIGSSFALGEAALGAFLVVGFTLHNITEGVGIAAPLARERPALRHFIQLAALAGLPAILGTWIGGFVYSDVAAMLFLAIGAGAILQVIYEVTKLIARDSAKASLPLVSWGNLAGLMAGILIMYLTAFLVKF